MALRTHLAQQAQRDARLARRGARLDSDVVRGGARHEPLLAQVGQQLERALPLPALARVRLRVRVRVRVRLRVRVRVRVRVRLR